MTVISDKMGNIFYYKLLMIWQGDWNKMSETVIYQLLPLLQHRWIDMEMER